MFKNFVLRNTIGISKVRINLYVDTDLLLIGGGSAGCIAAIAAREQSPEVAVTILEKGGTSRVLRRLIPSLIISGHQYIFQCTCVFEEEIQRNKLIGIIYRILT